MSARQQAKEIESAPVHSCGCAVCEVRFEPAADSPRLRVREFDFCLCSADCATRLLSHPDVYVAARQRILLPTSAEPVKCPFGPGFCPLTHINSESKTT